VLDQEHRASVGVKPLSLLQQLEALDLAQMVISDQEGHRLAPVSQLAQPVQRRRCLGRAGGRVPAGGEPAPELPLERPRHPRVAPDREQQGTRGAVG
jgi:hypothetical protein